MRHSRCRTAHLHLSLRGVVCVGIGGDVGICCSLHMQQAIENKATQGGIGSCADDAFQVWFLDAQANVKEKNKEFGGEI